MATEDQKSQIELEVILRDSTSTVLKQMTAQFDAFNKQVLKGGDSSSKAWDNFNKVMVNVEEVSKKSTRAVAGLSGILGAIPKQLLGPLGLAAGLYEVGKALTSFTANQAALRNMAEDAGYTAQAFRQLQNVFELMGNSPEVARQKLVKFGETMQDLRLNQIDSKFFKNLANNIIGGSELAHRYLGMVKADKPFEEIYSDIAQEHDRQQKIIDEAKKSGNQSAVTNARRIQSILEEGAGTASDLSQFEKRRRQARPVTRFSAEEIAAQEKANDAWILMWQQFYNNLDAVKAQGTLKLMDTFDSLMAPLKKLYDFASQAKTQVNRAASGEGVDPRSIVGRLRSGGIPAVLPSSTIDATHKLGLLGGIKDILKRMEDKTGGLFVSPAAPSSYGSSQSSASSDATSIPSLGTTIPSFPSGGAAPLIAVPPSILSTPSGGASSFSSRFNAIESRAEGGSVSAGQSYLVGEEGPELVKPNRLQSALHSGLGYYQSGVDWINDTSAPGVDKGSESFLHRLHRKIKPDIESVMDQTMPMNPILFLKHLAKQYEKGQPEASFADRFTSVWSNQLDKSYATASRKITGNVSASVDFSDMPLDEKREIFLPVDISTAPKAAKAAISYNKWAYQ